MGISQDLIAALCPRPCKGPITLSQRRLLPSGDVEITGEFPPPLCDPCPQRSNPKAPIRHLEVRWGFEAGGDVGEIVDTESTTVAGAGIATIKVVYDDPRGTHPGR
jgi:hypothetical protein